MTDLCSAFEWTILDLNPPLKPESYALLTPNPTLLSRWIKKAYSASEIKELIGILEENKSIKKN